MIYTDNLLATVFSANVGESEAEQRFAVARIAGNPDARQRDGLREELGSALADHDFDWETLLDRHEVYPDIEESARQFIVDRVWIPLFGPETIPSLRRGDKELPGVTIVHRSLPRFTDRQLDPAGRCRRRLCQLLRRW